MPIVIVRNLFDVLEIQLYPSYFAVMAYGIIALSRVCLSTVSVPYPECPHRIKRQFVLLGSNGLSASLHHHPKTETSEILPR